MPTRFQQQVYGIVAKIPRGYVTTYQAVAHVLGTRAYRAVGQALRANPYAPKVPCHRVIAADLSLGGFQGARAGRRLRRKIVLLRAEGVVFERGYLADPSRLHDFSNAGSRHG